MSIYGNRCGLPGHDAPHAVAEVADVLRRVALDVDVPQGSARWAVMNNHELFRMMIRINSFHEGLTKKQDVCEQLRSQGITSLHLVCSCLLLKWHVEDGNYR